MNNVGPPSALPPLTAQVRLDFELVVLTGLLVGLLVLGIAAIVYFKRRQADERQTPAAPRLEDYRALLEQGVLEPPEFERIREHLQKKDTPGSPTPKAPLADPM